MHHHPLQPNSNSPTEYDLRSTQPLQALRTTLISFKAIFGGFLSLFPEVPQSHRCHGVTEEGSPQGTISAAAPGRNSLPWLFANMSFFCSR